MVTRCIVNGEMVDDCGEKIEGCGEKMIREVVDVVMLVS